MSSVLEQQVIEVVTVTQQELLKEERERLKDKMKPDENEKRHKKAGGDLEVLTNCITTRSAMKVAGQREEFPSNSHY